MFNLGLYLAGDQDRFRGFAPIFICRLQVSDSYDFPLYLGKIQGDKIL